MRTALFPFKKPITKAMLCFGGGDVKLTILLNLALCFLLILFPNMIWNRLFAKKLKIKNDEEFSSATTSYLKSKNHSIFVPLNEKAKCEPNEIWG